MRLVAVSIIKNEADIVEAFCRHTAAVADEHLIFEHASTDGTHLLLAKLIREGLPIRLFHDDYVEQRQAERTTELMHRAVRECRADWVLPLDADEFLQAQGGPDRVRIHLAEQRQPLHLWMHDYAPHPHDDAAEPNPALRIQHWTGLHKRPHVKVIAPRSFAATAHLSGGNHQLLSADGRVIPTEEVNTLWLAHFPVRSCAQAINKVITGELQRLMLGTDSVHYQTHFQHLVAGGGDYFTDPTAYLRGLFPRPAQYWGQPMQWSPPLADWPRLAASVLPFVQQVAANYGQLRVQSQRKPFWQRLLGRIQSSSTMREWKPVDAQSLRDFGAKLQVSDLRYAGEAIAFRLAITNLRTATWQPGLVNIGVQAWNANGVLDGLDHYRHPLPGVVEAGESICVEVRCPPPVRGGFCTVNLVVEQVGWFDTPTAMIDPAAISVRSAA